MNKINEIKSCIATELAAYQDLLTKTLHTRVPLADSVIRYFLERKGKGVRPIVTLLAAKMLAGEVTQQTYDAAVALELLHSATLMHDDVVDESMQRRGDATINRVWDNKVAVLMGDFFLAKSLLRINATNSFAISGILVEMVTRLSEGELAQLANMRAHVTGESAYFEVIADKTASLFSACMKIGAYSVNASEDIVERMGLIGEKMGLVFQIRDDIFDYLPSSEMGKPAGHDIQEGKVTLPLLYALQQAPDAEAQRIKSLIENAEEMTSEEIAEVVHFAVSRGGIDYAVAKMKNIAHECRALLASFPPSEAGKALSSLIDYFVERNK